MRIEEINYEKIYRFLFAVFVSYYFVPLLSKSYTTVIGFCGVVVLVFFALSRPEKTFYFILATRSIIDVYLYNFKLFGLQIPQIVGVFTIVLVLYYLFISRFNIFKFGINKIIIWFVIFSFFPAIFHSSLVAGIGQWLRWSQGFLIINMTVLMLIKAGIGSYKKVINQLCLCILITSALPIFLFLKNMVLGEYVVELDMIRYATFGSGFTYFAYLLVVVFPVFLFKYSVAERNLKMIWLIVIAALLFLVYSTYVRTVWIGISFMLITMTLIMRKYVATLLILITAVSLIAFSPVVQTRLSDFIEVFNSEEGLFEMDEDMMNGRIGVFQVNLRYFIDKSSTMEKIIGNSSDLLLDGVKTRHYGKTRHNMEHNVYLVLLMHTGIMGLTIYMFYILKLLFESIKLWKNTNDIYLKNIAGIFISLLFAYLITGLGNHLIIMITFTFIFSVIAGIVVGANILERQKLQEQLQKEI